MPTYREITGLHEVHIQDGSDADARPDVVRLAGTVHFIPEFDGPAIVYDSGPLVRPETIEATLLAGQPQVSGGTLELLASDDDEANQTWTWRLQYTEVTAAGNSLALPDLIFTIPAGDGPFDITEGAAQVSGTSITTRGARGAGITSITAAQGVVTIKWAGGDDVSVPIPTAALATPENDGLMPSRTMEAVAPIKTGEDDQWRVMDMRGAVALAVTGNGGVRAGGSESRASGAPFRLIDSSGLVALEVDAQGRTHIHDPATGIGVSEWHVFVAAGQSNMSGPGRPGGPEYDLPDPRILQYGSLTRELAPATVPLDMHGPSSGLSPAHAFAREYVMRQPANIGVVLIPAAHGGSRFVEEASTTGLTWSNGKATDPANALYELSVEQTLEAMSVLDGNGMTASIKGVLWHQGEGNAGMGEAYADHFDPLIDDYRADLDNPDMPVLVGQMQMDIEPESSGKSGVDRVHADTPRRKLRTAFAPAPLNGARHDDYTHFSRAAVIDLGTSYYGAYWRAIANVEGSVPSTPQNPAARFVDGDLDVSWEAPICRVTGYRVEYSLDGGAWIDHPRLHPMNLHETITGLTAATVAVRVVAQHDALESHPTHRLIAVGA